MKATRSAGTGRVTKAPTRKSPPAKTEREVFDLNRAIFLTGEIDDEMVADLTPRILALAQDTRRHITLFIDSDGGNVMAAKVILGLLRTPNQLGEHCPLCTVVTGRACSAAAALLSAGDNILAYPHSNIHFHGIRIGEDTLTAEKAREYEQGLLNKNRSATVTLAASVFPRLLHNYSRLIDTIRLKRDSATVELPAFDRLYTKNGIDLPAFVFSLREKLANPYDDLVMHCLCQTDRRAAIVESYRHCQQSGKQFAPIIRSALRRTDSKNPIGKEVVLLETMLAERIENDADWKLSSADFSQLEQEFQELQAVADGSFQDEVLEQVLRFDRLFMSQKERQFCARHGEAKSARLRAKADKIVERVYREIEPLWSFTVGLCGLLYKGENPMEPEDAWWLGLIDEVIGTPLTSRELPKSIRESLIQNMPLGAATNYC